MHIIQTKERLNSSVARIRVKAPLIAAKAQPGQFVILRAKENSERIPLTIADSDVPSGLITLNYQVVGAGTMELDELGTGEPLHDLVGPLGVPTHTEGLKRVCIIGGGVGCAIAYPVAKKLRQQLCCVDTIIGFRTRNLVILRDEFSKISNELYLMTDDGTAGRSGLVTEMLETLLKMGKKYDEVIAIGPLPMMKYVCEVTKKYGIKTVVSMNPIMIDGTGMCGGCRLTVGGETKFACVDGPDFDGHLVDFDEAMARSSMYHEFEAHAREASCYLLNKEVE